MALSTGLHFLLVILTINEASVFAAIEYSHPNPRPIIGILAQEPPYRISVQQPGVYQSYIAASYVKFVESAGARVVPIFIGQPESYYEDLLSGINGVLFPGGATFFNQTGGYADAGEIIYRLAKKYNEAGIYFPLWGTCLGFELMFYLAANREEYRSKCNSHRQAVPLEFVPDFQDSRMFKNAPSDVIDILRRKNVTANYHRYCVTREDLRKTNLTEEYRVISLNKDTEGLEFISSFEHVRLPFYGVQFHPEKNIFEWKTGINIPHGPSAVRIAHYFADFFVREAQKNHHAFRSKDEEKRKLIYNYPATYSGLQMSDFEQIYLFENSLFHVNRVD